LHGVTEPLVTAEFFPASIALLYFVFLSVSLLKKGGKKYRKIQKKIPEKLAYYIYYQYFKSIIKNARQSVVPTWRFKKIKYETTTLFVRRLRRLYIVLIHKALERTAWVVVSSPKLVRKIFLSKFPDCFISRLLRKCQFPSGIAGFSWERDKNYPVIILFRFFHG